MINNCNQENDVYTKSLAADQEVTDLSEEQLRDVLEQLTDHNLPDSDKCPLVRRLNAENASKDEPDLVISRFCKSSTTSTTTTSPPTQNTFRTRKPRNSHRLGSKDAEFAREKTNGTNIKAVHSSQSLQDLMSSANSDTDLPTDRQMIRAIGVAKNSGGKRLNKASRANSFTMPSGSQNFCNDNYSNKETFDEVMSSVESRTNSQSHTQLKTTRNKSVKSRPTHTAGNLPVAESFSRSGEESSLSSDAAISSRSVHECSAARSLHSDNHNMNNTCDNYCNSLCNSSAPAVVASGDHHCDIEMKDMRRKVNIIEYSSDMNSVDSFLDLGLNAVHHKEGSQEPKEYLNDDRRLMHFQGAEAVRAYEQTNCSSYQDSDLANFQQSQQLANKDTPVRNNTNKKKKKPEPQVKLSEEIEGHIGYKDVDYLESFVNSNDSSKQTVESITKNGTPLLSNPSVKDSGKKKEKTVSQPQPIVANNVPKRKNGSNVTGNQSGSAHKNSVSPNIPLSTSSSSFSSDEVNSVSKHSDFAQRTDSIPNETTSPLNSSSDSKQKQLSREDSDNLDDDRVHTTSTFNSSFNNLMTSNISADLLYTASDSEMADREKGFVTPKSKHFKRRRGLMRRTQTENQNHQKSWSVQSSTSTTPSSSTVGGVGHHQYDRYSTGMRGYESEREYTDDFRNGRKPNNSSYNRRKSLSSVPHSEQNSAYNSDGELSSHSMPMRNDSVTTEKSNSDSRTTPSSISSTPKASYADIAKHMNYNMSSKRTSMDAIYTNNSMMSSLPVQYQDFPQLDISLPPVTDVLTPSGTNSKMIEALVSPSPKTTAEKRDLKSDSYSAPTSMTNTPIPQNVSQNECLYSETARDSNTYHKTDDEISDAVESASVPAVIMCDYSESVPFAGSVTFGFFDDLSASSEQNTTKTETHIKTNNESDLKEKNVVKPMRTGPENKSQVTFNGPKHSNVQLKYIDGDKKSFNYEHIIYFIRKAWDSAKCDHHYVNYESPKIN